MLSLHVLAGPKHHALQHEWVRRMRTAPRELRRAIDRFGFVYRRFLPNFLYPDPRHDFRPFAEEVDWLGSLDAQLVAVELTRPFFPYLDREQLSDKVIRRRALAFARRSGAHVATVALAFDEPEELRDGFVELVAAYWEAGFAAEWERLEPLLAESVVEAGRRIAADGVYAFLVGLAPALRVDLRREEFGFDLPHDHVVPVTEESELVLVPSAYVWPHVRLNCDAPWPVGLIYPAPFVSREARPRIATGELVRLLKALGDDTRLRALRLIAERPRSTQELAPLVGISEAGLSKHLRLLAECGVLESRREGYYVLYSLRAERVEPLSQTLLSFLGGGAG